MHLMNKEYNLRSTSIAYFRTTEVIWQIEKMSFGQNLVEKGEMYLELSHMMLESGSISSAYSWAFKSLQVSTCITFLEFPMLHYDQVPLWDDTPWNYRTVQQIMCHVSWEKMFVCQVINDLSYCVKKKLKFAGIKKQIR